MVFWHSKHGGAGKSWILGLIRNTFRAIRAVVPMTNKDMNEDQMQRGGLQQFGLARATYGEEIKDRGADHSTWDVDFFNNFVGGGEMSQNRRRDPHYETVSFPQQTFWSCNRPPIFAGAKTRKELGPALRRMLAIQARSRFFEQSYVEPGFTPEPSKLEISADRAMNVKKDDNAYAKAFLEGHLLPHVLRHGLGAWGKMAASPPECVLLFTREFKDMVVEEHEAHAARFAHGAASVSWGRGAPSLGDIRRPDAATQRVAMRTFLLATYHYDPAAGAQFHEVWVDYVQFCDTQGVPPAFRLRRNFDFIGNLSTTRFLGDGLLTYNGKEKKKRLARFHVYGIRKGPAPTQNLPAAMLEAAPNPMASVRGQGDDELHCLFPDGEDFCTPGYLSRTACSRSGTVGIRASRCTR